MRSATLLRLAYVGFSYALVPLLLLHLFWRGLTAPGYRRRIRERFGLGMPRLAEASIWVHAVSVGEVQAAAPMIRALLARHPDTPLVVTTMTPTGSERVRSLFGDQVVHSYVPYDIASAVRRFFWWARPRLAIIMETELWPNLYHECGRRRVPLVLASARVSARSAERYRYLVGLIRDTLSHGIVIAAQTEADAQRFRGLGANPARTHVTGNIKFDFELPADTASRGREFRAQHAPSRSVWIAASTHEGEEERLLEAHRAVMAAHPDALLILVPRHPERFAGVAALLQRWGFSFVTRSSGEDCRGGTSVFLGDSMGELTTFYAASDVAFVAGSLAPIGGHNLLEPTALGVPVITGPHNENAADIAELLLEAGAARVAGTPRDIARAASALLSDAEGRARCAGAGLDALARNRGSLGRLLALVEPLIG